MEKYYKLLGLTLAEVEEILSKENITYSIETTVSKKDKDKLIIPRVIKISQIDDEIKLLITYFSDSLI